MLTPKNIDASDMHKQAILKLFVGSCSFGIIELQNTLPTDLPNDLRYKNIVRLVLKFLILKLQCPICDLNGNTKKRLQLSGSLMRT